MEVGVWIQHKILIALLRLRKILNSSTIEEANEYVENLTIIIVEKY